MVSGLQYGPSYRLAISRVGAGRRARPTVEPVKYIYILDTVYTPVVTPSFVYILLATCLDPLFNSILWKLTLKSPNSKTFLLMHILFGYTVQST